MDETGTEAAAATGVAMEAPSAAMPVAEPPPQIFQADHPFLFFLRDSHTGLILFMGRVAEPR
jgi:serpin B